MLDYENMNHHGAGVINCSLRMSEETRATHKIGSTIQIQDTYHIRHCGHDVLGLQAASFRPWNLLTWLSSSARRFLMLNVFP